MKTNFKITALAVMCIGLNMLAGHVPDSSAKKNNTFLQKEKDGSYRPHSVIKWNLSQLGLTNFSFQYEFAFHKNLSIACGFSRLVPKAFPGFFADKDPTGQGLRSPIYSGFAITPEFRIYPGKKEKHQAPHGFYFAPYVRYAKYTFTSGYLDNYNGQNYSYDLTSTYKGVTGGLMIGYQWIIAKHLSIDFWIAGAGFGSAKLALGANVQGLSIPPDEQENIRQSLTDELSSVKFINASDPVVTTTDHSVQASINSMPMISLRGLGFCLGFAF